MFLDSNRKLVGVMTAAATTYNLPVDVDFVDIGAAYTTPNPGDIYTNGTTPVTLVASPAVSTVLVTAGAFVVGVNYRIAAIGSTDFTLVGASASTVGIVFSATGAGTGTGTVAESPLRKVNELTVYQRDTAAKTIRVYRVDSTPGTGLITATGFVVGNDYQIVSAGTTNFTLIGAANSTPGTIFTATGAGTGTGTAATAYQKVDLQINVDDTLGYTDTEGWYAVDSLGNLKSVQAASATSIANAITSSAEKAVPVGVDKVGIVDSVTGLLNWSSFTDMLSWFAALAGSASQVFSVGTATAADHAVKLKQVSLMPTVASAATTMDIFGAAGATVSASGTTTVTSIPNCTTAQVGSAKTIIPSDAAGFSITATANIVVNGATSGTYLMPKDANIQIIATSISTFKITTMTGIAVSGSNVNGSYIKFADGTMICHHILSAGGNVSTVEGAICTTPSTTWTFPATFISTPSVSVTENNGVGNCWGALGSVSTSNSSTSFSLKRALAVAAVPAASLIAIGMWK